MNQLIQAVAKCPRCHGEVPPSAGPRVRIYCGVKCKNAVMSTRWREAHPGKQTEKTKQWNESNPTRAREQGRRKTARRRAVVASLRRDDVDTIALVVAHNGVCGICGLPIGPHYHIDHIIPASKGGPWTWENLQPAHPLCNRRKGARICVPYQQPFLTP